MNLGSRVELVGAMTILVMTGAGCDRPAPGTVPSSPTRTPTAPVHEETDRAADAPTTKPQSSAEAAECKASFAELQQRREAAGNPRLERVPGLDAAAAKYAERATRGNKATTELADEVHALLGPHGEASFDVVAGASEVMHLREAGMPETRLVGIGCARNAEPKWTIVIVYARKNAWPFSREDRARLRQGADAYVGAFLARYRRDAAWTRRYDDAATREGAVAEVRAQAAAAAGLSPTEFESRLRLAPTIADTMTVRVLQGQLDAELEYQRKLGARQPPRAPSQVKYAQDL